jgi:hypothetical protein
MEKLVEWTVLAGEPEVFGENLPPRQFDHHKSHWPDRGANPGRRGRKPATNRFSYGAATDPIRIATTSNYTNLTELHTPNITVTLCTPVVP